MPPGALRCFHLSVLKTIDAFGLNKRRFELWPQRSWGWDTGIVLVSWHKQSEQLHSEADNNFLSLSPLIDCVGG